MSFTSFSTTILYNEETVPSVIQPAEETADPNQGNPSDGLRNSYFHSCSKFSHSIHELAKRKAKPEIKTPMPWKASNSSKTEEHPATNKTSKSSVPDGGFETAYIAASSIFGALAAGAVVFLMILLVKKFRRRRRRKKEGYGDPPDEKRWRREALMFCKDPSGEYLVEQKNGAVTRVLCTNKSARISKFNSSSSGSLLVPTSRPPLDTRAKVARHMEELSDSHSGRSGSIPKQAVLVSSPLRAVVSRTAVPDSELISPINLKEPPEKLEAITSPNLESMHMDEQIEIEPTPSNSHRNSFRSSIFRLPSIRQSMSPLFHF
ncbi:hypothetical protein BDW59DRAFT_115210 [Aspergillus cavernicola]|uniref:Uncharacterized protein n=1 Tax=Aspergillus cavernicola TaxID=176166 RepID=A0ABR4IWD2_9EURO